MKEEIKDKTKLDTKVKGRIRRAKKPYSHTVSNDSRTITRGPNDISWRTKSSLAPLAGTLPFGIPSGIHYKDLGTAITGLADSFVYTNPGILVFKMLLMAGNSADYNSAFNLATRKIYSFVRHANSGSKNYEAADLGMYFLSLGQGIGMLSFLQRLYKTITKFSTTNRYTPDALVKSMGVNYDDIKQHQAELAWLIRWLGNSLNSLAAPKMAYFDSCYFAFLHIFKDSESPKEQFYMFVPDAFGIYDPTYDTNGGGVKFNDTDMSFPGASYTSLKTYADLVAMVHKLMDVLLSDEDVGIMSGDILKAYGEGGLFKAQAESDSDIIFEHSEEILQQIHNANCISGSLISVKGYKQNPGATNTAPFIEQDLASGSQSIASSYHVAKQYIDAFSKEPDYKEVFNCCVLKSLCGVKAVSSSYYADPDTCVFGNYFVRDVWIVTGCGGSYTRFSIASMFNPVYQFTTGSLGYSGNYKVTNFDWHPLVLIADTSISEYAFLGDVQNLNFFSNEVFKRIFDTSMLSLFEFVE
jgi:hypothetical protein